MCTSAPLLRSSRTTSRCPSSDANIKGVLLLVDCELMLAPRSRRSWATFAYPLLDAICNGVQSLKLVHLAFTFTLCWSNRYTTPMCPRLDATCNGAPE